MLDILEKIIKSDIKLGQVKEKCIRNFLLKIYSGNVHQKLVIVPYLLLANNAKQADQVRNSLG